MADEQLYAVGIVCLAHLFLLFPSRSRRVVQSDVTIVEVGICRIADPEVCRTDFDEGNPGISPDRGFVCYPESAHSEDAGGGTPISLFLDSSQPRVAVQSQSPNQSAVTQSGADGSQHSYPVSPGGFFHQGECHMRAIPVIRYTYDGL